MLKLNGTLISRGTPTIEVSTWTSMDIYTDSELQ